MTQCHIRKLPVGYLYWVTVGHGWCLRQIGRDFTAIVDDFGNLVFDWNQK